MGLVDYSDSESETEAVTKPAPPASAPADSKKPFQKVVDRSKPGKIVVSLPGAGPDETKPTTDGDDERPAKRARTAGGGGAFGGFNSFLPAPKNVGKPAASTSGSSSSSNNNSGKGAPRPGINLKTGATPGFSRDTDDNNDGTRVNGNSGEPSTNTGGMSLPAPKAQQPQPSIPAGQKPAEEVRLVGKPLMFKPLSVSRKPGKKNVAKAATVSRTTVEASPSPAAPISQTTQVAEVKQEAPPPKKKGSLFSISDDIPDEAETTASNGVYEPMFGSTAAADSELSNAEAFAAYDAQFASSSSSSSATATASTYPTRQKADSLDNIASDMNLSAAARRELFGRSGAPGPAQSAARVINFNTEREYAHNEELRASGEQQIHNPVRAIAPGKHNLRQLVNQVHNQREALEESFAKGKGAQREAGSRYGWR